MRPLEELLEKEEPAWPLVQEWAARADIPVELLPPSSRRAECLHKSQVTTRSPMGAITYETGGISILNGWLRILGSGSTQIPRSISEWNEGRSSGFYLFADDAVGGFYALNGGFFGANMGSVFYWSPDCLEWEACDLTYTQFLQWAFSKNVYDYYDSLMWQNWADDLAQLEPDKTFIFYPFLWTEQGSIESSHRGIAPVQETWGVKVDLLRQLSQNGA